jgi:hypothetical protein
MNVQVHDPAVKALPDQWRGKVEAFDDPISALQGAQALAIATEWPLYRDVVVKPATNGANLIVLDANRFLPRLATVEGVRYVAVGVPDKLV